MTLLQAHEIIKAGLKTETNEVKVMELIKLKGLITELATNVNTTRIETIIVDYNTTIETAIEKTKKVINGYEFLKAQYLNDLDARLKLLKNYTANNK